MNKRKGISTKISPHDQSIIKYIYYNYDPREIQRMQFLIGVGQRYIKGCGVGFIDMKSKSSEKNQDSKNQQKNAIQDKGLGTVIKLLDTGTLVSISSNLEKTQTSEGEQYIVKKWTQKKPVLELFQIRLCQHIPWQSTVKRLLSEQKRQQGTGNNSKINKQKYKKTRKKQRVDPIYCKHCNQRLFFFYLPQQISITYSQIQSQLDTAQPEQIQLIQWTVKLGQTFTKSTEVAKLQDKEFRLGENGKITYLVNWGSVQDPSQSFQVLKYRQIFCQHQKIQLNVCQYCFEQVDPWELNLKKYLFQMQEKDDVKRDMITAGSALTQQENQYVDNLLSQQRGILILDLDNTVLHSIQLGQIPKSRIGEMQQFYELLVGRMMSFNNTIVTTCFIVKMRPFFKEFIQTIIKYYEIYVYTKGTRMYAQQICNAIRNQYASKQQYSNNKNQKIKYYDFLKDKNAFKINRVITRDEDPNLQRKSLDNILPTRQQNLLIMDDLSSIWNYSSAVLYTVPYHYFFKQRHIQQAQKQRVSNGSSENNNKLLNESKQGLKLNVGINLHVNNNVQPVSQLACDHFQREILQIQKNHVQGRNIQPVEQLQCDHLKGEIVQITNENLLALLDTQKQQIGTDTNNVIELKRGVAPQDKQFDYDILPRDDYYLIFAAYNLTRIHRRFFAEKRSPKIDCNKISFAQMQRSLKSQILEGKVIKFCMKNQNRIDIYGRTMKLGCKVLQNQNNEIPQYIIRLNNLSQHVSRMYFKKQELKQKQQVQKNQEEILKSIMKQLKFLSQTLKIPVVSESWVNFCYSFTYQFPVEPFVIESQDIFTNVNEESFEWLIQQHGKNLLAEITKQNEFFYNQKQKNKHKIQLQKDELQSMFQKRNK